MQFAIDLMQKIPAGWPRLATLAAIVIVYFFFPSLVKQLTGGQREKEQLAAGSWLLSSHGGRCVRVFSTV